MRMSLLIKLCAEKMGSKTRRWEVNQLSFNGTFEFFTCAMESGFRIYGTEPLVEYHQERLRIEEIGSVSICEMYNRDKWLAIVSGGNRPKYAPNELKVYNMKRREIVGTIKFTTDILAVRLKYDMAIIALKDYVWLWSWPAVGAPGKIAGFPTYSNPLGVLAMSVTPCDKPLALFPANKPGNLHILDISRIQPNVTSYPIALSCHESDLAYVTLSMDSKKCATASIQGTLIRVWDLVNKVKLIELRRGSDVATIYCLNFSPTADYLCCASDKGTIHIWAIVNVSLNKRFLGMLTSPPKLLGNYGDSNYSCANFFIAPDTPTKCAFQGTNNIIAICADGCYHKFAFNRDGCKRIRYEHYLKLYDDFLDSVGNGVSNRR